MSGEILSVRIEGRTLEIPAGSTILDAARLVGIEIPALCRLERGPASEACRLCVVEVEGLDRPVSACSTEVTEGMRVSCFSHRLQREREAIFDLMLADHYGDCRPPCNQRCPAGIDIQGYIALIGRKRYLEAARLIRRTNPLPLTCGRVCPHPCESQCRRGRVDEPVNINHLKRFACDIAYQDLDALNPKPAESTGHQVAIVGGGPAGLTAAYYLALAGHRPTIFEANKDLGGMLRYGIPSYRLPKDVLDREIEAIVRMGVVVRTGRIWGINFTLADLVEPKFGAIFLATGAAVNRELNFIPDDTPGVNYGTCFLGEVALGMDTNLGKRVVVIGGGNTAMDCARTALRLGAEEVAVYYRRSRKQMPAQDIEVQEAEEEGISFEFCVSPVAIETNGPNGRLSAMSFVRMDLCGLDASGRARPEPIKGSEFSHAFDTAVVAVGQVVDEERMSGEPWLAGLTRTRWGSVKTDSLTGLTNIAGLFAAGDLVSGPATVVEAIGGARRSAGAIDRYLRGLGPAPGREFIYSKGTLAEVDQANFEDHPKLERQEMLCVSAEVRRSNFEQVELGLTEEQALAEAKRCLSCGCMAVDDCRIRELAHELGRRDLLMRPEPLLPVAISRDHSYITVEDGKCLVCRRCELVCRHYHGRDAIEIDLERVGDLAAGRGHHLTITPRCNNCGLCVEVCPTGALSFKTEWTQPGPLTPDWADSVCTMCSLGCRTQVGVKGSHLVRIRGQEDSPTRGHLCRRGRFELAEIRRAPLRVRAPMLRQHGQLLEVDWKQALGALDQSVSAIRESAGPEALAGLTFGRASLEELYLFGKLVRLGMGTNNLDYLDPTAAEPMTGAILANLSGGPPMPPYDQIEDYGRVVLVGSGFTRAAPLLESALGRMRAGGGRLILAGRDPAMGELADEHLDLGPAAAWDQAAQMVAGREPGDDHWLILGAESSLGRSSKDSFAAFLSELAAAEGGSVDFGMMPAVPAGRALYAAGISPVHYPGNRRVSDASRAVMERASGRKLAEGPGLFAHQILSAAAEGSIKGLIIQGGHNPAWDQPSAALLKAAESVEFLAVLATCGGPLVDLADLVLPKLLVYESGGTFVAADGKGYEVAAALDPPPGLWPDWMVLTKATKALGGGSGASDLVGVQSEMIVLSQAFAE